WSDEDATSALVPAGRDGRDRGDDSMVSRLADKPAVRHLGLYRVGETSGGRGLFERRARGGLGTRHDSEAQRLCRGPVPVPGPLHRSVHDYTSRAEECGGRSSRGAVLDAESCADAGRRLCRRATRALSRSSGIGICARALVNRANPENGRWPASSATRSQPRGSVRKASVSVAPPHSRIPLGSRAPVKGGNDMGTMSWSFDTRILNATMLNGQLYADHTVGCGGAPSGAAPRIGGPVQVVSVVPVHDAPVFLAAGPDGNLW